MQQLSFKLLVAIHRQDKFASGPDSSTSTLSEGKTKGLDLPETPKAGTFRRGATDTRTHLHLQFRGEVVRENSGEHRLELFDRVAQDDGALADVEDFALSAPGPGDASGNKRLTDPTLSAPTIQGNSQQLRRC